MGSFQGLLETDAMLGDQREVYEYWLRLKRGDDIPAKCDFRPAAIVRRLPMVSLMDVSDCERRFRFRLAGTGLREVFGEELTGRYLSDLIAGETAEFWHNVYEGVADDGAPAQGYTKLVWRERPVVLQAWLRLPLAGPDGRVTTILGYDRFLPMERMTARPRAAEPARVYATAM